VSPPIFLTFSRFLERDLVVVEINERAGYLPVKATSEILS